MRLHIYKMFVSLHHNNNTKIRIMKTLLNKIDKLTETIEMGLLTKEEALFEIRKMRSNILDKYEEGSDKFMQCIYPLIDANEIAKCL